MQSTGHTSTQEASLVHAQASVITYVNSAGLQALDDHRLSLSSAHAHGLQPPLAIDLIKAVEQGGHDSQASHPERMPDGDTAAMRVHAVIEGVDADRSADGD